MSEIKPEVFTSDERRQFREEINSLRRPGAHLPDQWSVSPLNRDPSVVGEMPRAIRFRDIALRAIDSLPGVVATVQAKRDYLRELVEAGVPEIVTAAVREMPTSQLQLPRSRPYTPYLPASSPTGSKGCPRPVSGLLAITSHTTTRSLETEFTIGAAWTS